jgi:YihY family inner membrane protein
VDEARREPWLWTRRVLRFAGRVFASFFHNRGFLLAGGVAYNALLSLIPFLAVVLSVFSSFFDERRILDVLGAEVSELLPQQTDTILDTARTFLSHRAPTGILSLALLLFFSSIAFRMLEEAVAAIFHASLEGARRRIWVSVVLPYLFIVPLVAALFAMTVTTHLLDALGERSVRIFAVERSLEAGVAWLLRVLNFAGLVVAFTAIYRVLPVVRITISRALVGGFVAALLWRGVARFLVYFFAHISQANVVYGSLATAVVTLLYLEILFILILLGAQVIAELEASAAAGLHWWERPSGRVVHRRQGPSGPASDEAARQPPR